MAENLPVDLAYTESDEWVRREGDVAVVGVTAYAADQLGDVVYVQLPDVGKHFDKEQPFGEIESVKAVSDLNSPVAGEVVDANQQLDQNPNLVNDDPYGEGWMVKIRVDDAGAFEALLSAQEYEKKTLETH